MILIVGAGPTGLVLALWLTRLGVLVRVIDQATEPGTTSRALAVQARTLELYQQIGLAADVTERGLLFAAVNVWIRGKRVGHAEFGAIGEGITPFPTVVIFPQDQHERLLIEHLDRAGTRVERGTTLAGFEDRGDGVTAEIRRADGTIEQVAADYLIGCDGARSRVREVLGTGFPGGTYERIFYVADVQVDGPLANHQLHVALDDADFLAVFPLKAEGAARLIGTVLPSALARGDTLSWDDVSPAVLARLKINVRKVNWFSTYHVHHRVASQFREGRAFLVGDAAHIHSPVGGQGMNTGIGDAVNLAWKLAAVVQQRADATLLDSYEPERLAFARKLVATTDRAFTFSSANGPIARVVRFHLLPRLLPWLLNRAFVRRFLFRTISQTLVNYRHGTLSEGATGTLRGGDRLPWIKPDSDATSDNFTPLTSLDWQVHVYGKPAPEIVRGCTERSLPLHRLDWREPMRDAGLRRNAAYLVRPDGYIAIAGATAASLARYLDARRIVASDVAKDRAQG
jgi:2-polyprenyl-6-methoxyphenol hydroxylase-like FAD-dependent oxidoreductase